MDFQIPLSLDNAAGKVDLKDLAPLEVGIMLKGTLDQLTSHPATTDDSLCDGQMWPIRLLQKQIKLWMKSSGMRCCRL